MYKIIPEVCRAIFEEMRGRYLAFPNVDDWQAISLQFEQRWNFPHVLGMYTATVLKNVSFIAVFIF